MTISVEQLLEDLFDAYYDARKHKRNKASALLFELDCEQYLIDLCEDIYARKYKVGASTCFIVTKPVKREIFAANFKDRVVHHLIFRYIAPLFERTFIDDSFSCRTGRGTLYGVSRMHHHIKSCTTNFTKDAYILKLDIQGYFMNINRTLLYQKVISTMHKMASHPVYPKSKNDAKKPLTWEQKLDFSMLEYLLFEVIFNDPTYNCIKKGNDSQWIGLPSNKSLFGTPPQCGLPIGNLTSQLFSNIFLSDFDNYCKRELKLKHYGRYVDDFMIVHPDKQLLESLVARLSQYLEENFELSLHPKKVFLQHFSKGVSFLGVVIHGPVLVPASRIRKSTFMLIEETNIQARQWVTYDEDKMPLFAQRFRDSMNSYLGQMRHTKSVKLRTKLVSKISPYLRQWIVMERGIDVVKLLPMKVCEDQNLLFERLGG